eukprot:m.256742 g.256742  ORF g.256742 m.256742 type:complete len:55 (+) comp22480_c0_seq1:502-666(+)
MCPHTFHVSSTWTRQCTTCMRSGKDASKVMWAPLAIPKASKAIAISAHSAQDEA